MAQAFLQLLGGGAILTVAFGSLTSIGVKYFARPLPYWKALLISLAAFAPGTVLSLVFIKAFVKWPAAINSVATMSMLCVAGAIITKSARRFGIKKTGWLGVGAKSIMVLMVSGWLIVGIMYLGTLALGLSHFWWLPAQPWP